MILVRRNVLIGVCFSTLALSGAYAQEPPKPVPLPAPETPATPGAAQKPAPAAQPKPAATDDDTSETFAAIGLSYWYNPSHLHMRIGHGATVGDSPANLDFPGRTQYSPGISLAIPAGKYNTLQISYFQTRGNGSAATPQDIKIFGQSYTTGDVLNTGYKIQDLKLSWDYLSWPTPPTEKSLRFKTLWQVQYVNMKTDVDAPVLDVSTTSTFVTKNHYLIYPSLGVGFEKRFTHNFRWELKGSGFAIPHHATIWDAETFFAVHAGHIEMKFGGRAFHFKTTTKGVEYLYANLPGGFVEVSWRTR